MIYYERTRTKNLRFNLRKPPLGGTKNIDEIRDLLMGEKVEHSVSGESGAVYQVVVAINLKGANPRKYISVGFSIDPPGKGLKIVDADELTLVQ